MFTELSGLFFIRKIMYLKKMKFIEYVIYRLFSSWELQEHQQHTRGPVASQWPGAGAPPPDTCMVQAFACILLDDFAHPWPWQSEFGEGRMLALPAPHGNCHNGCFASCIAFF